MTDLLPALSSKTPTERRRFAAALSALLLVTFADHGVSAQGALTEAEVVRLALSRAPSSLIADATEGVADARQSTAGRLPNPSLSWQRETVETAPSSSQDILRATVPIDLATPLATRSRAASEAAWLRSTAATNRVNAALVALLAYYDVAVAHQRVEVLAQAVENLEDAARILALREEVGRSSGYESSRLAVARELSRSRHAQALGALSAARIRLAILLGMETEELRVEPELSLMADAALEERLGEGVRGRADYQRASESARHAREGAQRAEWTWIPSFGLEAGWKHVDQFGGGDGYVVGLSMSLPLSDHGQAQRAEAAAERALAEARSEALIRSLESELGQALTLYRVARDELHRFDSVTSEHVDALLVAARSGYREGERTIVELLDAQRAQVEVRERHIALLGAAKRAEARLRAATGDLR